MTFVSALFSRTHFNANYFAVLNESFKVISLFSYQSSLFVVFATAFIFYQKHLSLSTTFFIFLCCRFKRQPVYLITGDRLCQQLFFLLFFQQLSYIIMYSSACQQLFSFFYNCERRRRDLNPRAAVNDLHPFQGCPFGQLGYFSELK